MVFLTRRFWPLVGGADTSLALLASALQRRGAECRIATIRWQPDWPAVIDHHGVPVHRLPKPAAGRWGAWLHARRLQHWLSEQCPGLATICVSGLRHDAATAVRMARRRPWRVVLRSERAGLTGDCRWQLDAPGGRRTKRLCMKADTLLAPTKACENELIAAGYPRGRIHHAPCGVPAQEQTTAEARQAARRVLASAHPALGVLSDSPVAACTVRLEPEQGLEFLLESWRTILARWPHAKLWLVGEGSLAKSLSVSISKLGLGGSVVLPGAFDNLDDVLAAVDVHISPAIDTGTGFSLLSAMAAGLPIVATDLPGHQEFVAHGRQGLLTPAEDAAALGGAISQLFADEPMRAALGQAARARVQADFTLESMVDRFWNLCVDVEKP